MKTIPVLIYEPYVFKLYGNTRFLSGLFKFICKERVEPVLVSPVEGFFTNHIREMGGRCLVLAPPERLTWHGGRLLREGVAGRVLTGLAIARHSGDLRRVMQDTGAEIVHCNSIRALMTVLPAAKSGRKPILWYVKGDLANPLLDRIGFMVADRIIFQCESTKKRRYPALVQRYDRKIRLLQNGIDLEELRRVCAGDLSALRLELGLNKGNVHVVYVGQISPAKGLVHLVEALSDIGHEKPEITLYLVGDEGIPEYSSFAATLRDLIRVRGLEGRVVFLGYRWDAIQIVSQMDILVLPSLSEGVPSSILEAMALGKPVVATGVGGVREIVDHERTGFVVEPRDPKGLAAAIHALARDKGLRDAFGSRARQMAISQFGLRDKILELERYYAELLDGYRVSRDS